MSQDMITAILYLRAALSSLKDEQLTAEEIEQIRNTMRHHPDCDAPRECTCGMWTLRKRLSALRRISGTSPESDTK